MPWDLIRLRWDCPISLGVGLSLGHEPAFSKRQAIRFGGRLPLRNRVQLPATDWELLSLRPRKDGILLLVMEGDGKLERLTLGTDGRLFVEHYGNKDDYPEKKATHIGIGVRQK